VRRRIIAAMTVVLIPDPALVMLVGAAGSGKSTFAARHFAPDEVLSSDALRARLSGDEANQAVSRTAFAILHRALERRLAAGRLTVVDATNADARGRRDLTRRARAAGVPAVAFVLDLPHAVVLARNAGRARQVDEAVVRLQLARVQAALAPDGLAAEGLAMTWIGRTAADIDAIVVERVRSTDPPPRPARQAPKLK
jgi:protein phosphatase